MKQLTTQLTTLLILFFCAITTTVAWGGTETSSKTLWETHEIQGSSTKEISPNQTVTTDLNGCSFTYETDVLGRITKESISHNNGYNEVTIYSYDKLNRVTKVEQHNGDYSTTIERKYDPAGQILNETVALNDTILANWQQSWLAGKRTTLDFNQQPLWQFKTTATGKLYNMQFMGLQWNYEYSPAGLLKWRQTPLSPLALNHDRGGHIINQNIGKYFSQDLTWQEDEKLSSSVLKKQGVTEETKYTYNQKHLAKDNEASYIFDWGSDQGLGILTDVATPAHKYSIPKPNTGYLRPESESADGQELHTKYDNMGRVIEREFPDKKQLLKWDPHGRLIEVELNSNNNRIYLWQAFYDGFGRRIQTKFTPENQPTTTSTSLYDPEVEFLELGLIIKAENQQPRNIWKIYGPDNNGVYGANNGQNGLEMVADADTGALYIIINSLQGDIVASFNSGNFQFKKPISPYGPTEIPPKTNSNNPGELAQSIIDLMLWHNKMLDPTGFINFGARYYDPLTKRFLSCDPLGHLSTPDLYSYANGDPINNIDPDGRFASPFYKAVAPTVTSFLPVASTVQSLIETSTGRDCFTGEPVNRWVSGAALAISFIPGAKTVVKEVAPAVVKVAGAAERVLAREAVVAERGLAKAGEDLFVGTWREAEKANKLSGLKATHTPHHVVQNAVSREKGITINIKDELHAQTRTFRRPIEPAPDIRTHLSRDIRDLRGILKNDGYDQSTINRQLQELIQQNKQLGGFRK